MKKSEPLKRVNISPVEEVVDEAMAYLPHSLDLSDSQNRLKLRGWMVRICNEVVRRNAESFSVAVSNAIQEAAALCVNPEYYAERKARQVKNKARRAILQNAQKPRTRAERVFEKLDGSATKM